MAREQESNVKQGVGLRQVCCGASGDDEETSFHKPVVETSTFDLFAAPLMPVIKHNVVIMI